MQQQQQQAASATASFAGYPTFSLQQQQQQQAATLPRVAAPGAAGAGASTQQPQQHSIQQQLATGTAQIPVGKVADWNLDKKKRYELYEELWRNTLQGRRRTEGDAVDIGATPLPHPKLW